MIISAAEVRGSACVCVCVRVRVMGWDTGAPEATTDDACGRIHRLKDLINPTSTRITLPQVSSRRRCEDGVAFWVVLRPIPSIPEAGKLLLMLCCFHHTSTWPTGRTPPLGLVVQAGR